MPGIISGPYKRPTYEKENVNDIQPYLKRMYM